MPTAASTSASTRWLPSIPTGDGLGKVGKGVGMRVRGVGMGMKVVGVGVV